MFNLVIFLPIIFGYIISDQGYFKQTNFLIDSQFACQSNYENSYIIPFSSNFQNIPQITFFWKLLDIYYLQSEFQLAISSVSTNTFNITIKCPLFRVYGVEIYWFAIDDQRIQIISQFNTKDLKPKKTFEHKNPNAEFGIIIPTSFAFSGPFNLSIQITEITPKNVSIEIYNLIENNGLLNQIGYQIILGPKEAFTLIEEKTLFSSPYQSDVIEKQQQSWFFLILKQLIYQQSDNLYYLFNCEEGQSTISYKMPKWGIFNQVIIKAYWMTYKLTKNSIRLQLKQIEIIRNTLSTQQMMPLLQVEIFTQSDYNEIFNSTGVYSLLIGKFNYLLNFKISYICQQSETVEINFQNGNEAYNNTYSHTYNCNIQSSQIIYIFQFEVQYGTYQELILNFTDKNCQVEQIQFKNLMTKIQFLKDQIVVLFNQEKTQEKLFEIIII